MKALGQAPAQSLRAKTCKTHPSEIVRSAPIPRRLTKPSEDKWRPTIRVKAFVLFFIIKCSRKLPPELLDASKQMLP